MIQNLQLLEYGFTIYAYHITAYRVYAFYSQKKPTLAEKLGLTQAAEATLQMAADKMLYLLAQIESKRLDKLLK